MFRSESESEKPLEGTSRSESPINASPLAASPGKHSAFPACATAHLPSLVLGELQQAAPLVAAAFRPAGQREGATPEEEGTPSTGAKGAGCSPPAGTAPSLRARGAEAKFALPPSTGASRAPHIPPDPPGQDKARAPRRLQALSALPAPRRGAPRVTHSDPAPPPRELRRLLAALLCSPPPQG